MPHLVGVAGPDHLQAAGDGVLAFAGAVGALPAQPLLFDRGGLRLGADQIAVAGAVGLAEAVAADDECGGLFVVHCHPGERLTDVYCRGDWIRLAFGAFGIHIDQTHGGRTVGLREVALAGVALVGAQPVALFAEENLFGLPDVWAAEGEAEGLEPHRLQGALPAKMIRSAQEILLPYFCLTGHSSRRALSRLTLSGQLFIGAKRWAPWPPPPRPS